MSLKHVVFQVAPVFINQQNGTQIHTQAISLDLLKANGTPTLVTDSNGNHYLIALTSNTTDGQNGVSSVAKTNGRITLQVRQNWYSLLGCAGLIKMMLDEILTCVRCPLLEIAVDSK